MTNERCVFFNSGVGGFTVVVQTSHTVAAFESGALFTVSVTDDGRASFCGVSGVCGCISHVTRAARTISGYVIAHVTLY